MQRRYRCGAAEGHGEPARVRERWKPRHEGETRVYVARCAPEAGRTTSALFGLAREGAQKDKNGPSFESCSISFLIDHQLETWSSDAVVFRQSRYWWGRKTTPGSSLKGVTNV